MSPLATGLAVPLPSLTGPTGLVPRPTVTPDRIDTGSLPMQYKRPGDTFDNGPLDLEYWSLHFMGAYQLETTDYDTFDFWSSLQMAHTKTPRTLITSYRESGSANLLKALLDHDIDSTFAGTGIHREDAQLLRTEAQHLNRELIQIEAWLMALEQIRQNPDATRRIALEGELGTEILSALSQEELKWLWQEAPQHYYEPDSGKDTDVFGKVAGSWLYYKQVIAMASVNMAAYIFTKIEQSRLYQVEEAYMRAQDRATETIRPVHHMLAGGQLSKAGPIQSVRPCYRHILDNAHAMDFNKPQASYRELTADQIVYLRVTVPTGTANPMAAVKDYLSNNDSKGHITAIKSGRDHLRVSFNEGEQKVTIQVRLDRP